MHMVARQIYDHHRLATSEFITQAVTYVTQPESTSISAQHVFSTVHMPLAQGQHTTSATIKWSQLAPEVRNLASKTATIP